MFEKATPLSLLLFSRNVLSVDLILRKVNGDSRYLQLSGSSYQTKMNQVVWSKFCLIR